MLHKLVINDCTLRDGSHACSHQIKKNNFIRYVEAADNACVDYLEVGHGNGLGASSLQLGESLITESEMLALAKSGLKHAKLSVHVMPGFATIKKNISCAMEMGVNLFRVGAHCTEADITQRHIEHVRNKGFECWGILMMSHMANNQVLLDEIRKMISYGAQAIVLMDSAGTFLPDFIAERFKMISQECEVPLGFHAHNNLGLSVINSITAVQHGATILDASAAGFGAGAGNCAIELLVGVFNHMKWEHRIGVQLFNILYAADVAREIFNKDLPVNSSESIISGLAGVFSGFAKPVMRISKMMNVNPFDVFFELGKRKIIGGQEDIILELANELKNRKDTVNVKS